MDYLDPIDYTASGFSDYFDELPLWSAPFAMMLLDRVPVRRGLTILDVGAGTGFLTLELAERCGADSRVIAVDPWHDAMRRLRLKLAQRQLTNVSIYEQDAATLDLPEATVDVVVSNLGVNNFDEPARVLGACFRLAKPGAILLLTTNPVGHMAEFYAVIRAVLIEMGRECCLPALDAHINHRGTVDSVASLIQAAGFELADVATSSFRLRFADGSALLRHYFIRLGFVQGWKSVIKPEDAPAIFARLEARLNSLARDEGELALTIPMACLMGRKPLA
ncbi:MAG: methyltransferase domain-containing protein [Candidatus Eisenbacteria bacterium]